MIICKRPAHLDDHLQKATTTTTSQMFFGDLAPEYEISHKFFVFVNFLESSFGWFCDLFCTLNNFHRSLARCPTISADQVCQVNMLENTNR